MLPQERPLPRGGSEGPGERSRCAATDDRRRLKTGDDARTSVRPSPYAGRVRVLGIDPGTASCGFGVVEQRDGRVRRIEAGCWRSGPRERLELRLHRIFEGVTVLIQEHEPDAVAIE